MAHCYICDQSLDTVHLERVGGELKTRPCSTCLEAVREALEDHDTDRLLSELNESLDDYLQREVSVVDPAG